MLRLLPRRPRGTAALSVALLVAMTWAPLVRADSLEDQLKGAQKQLEGVRSSEREALAKLKQVENDATAAQVAYDKSVADLAAARSASQQAARALTEGEAELQRAEAELQNATARLDARRKAMAGRVRAAYVEGQVEFLEVLFASADFADFVTRYEYVRRVVAQDSRLVGEFKDLFQQAEQQRLAAVHHRDRLAALRREARDKEEAVSRRVAQVQQLQGELATQRANLEQYVDELNRKFEDLNGVILELQRQLARRAGKLQMRAPVDYVELTDGFGMRLHPILNKYKMHFGQDFAVGYGAPVFAAEEGRVLMAAWDDAFGNYVVIDHGEVKGKLISTLYAHNSSLLVSPGQEVKRGQAISRAGSTGWSTGPHVHFEVRVNGVPQDPVEWLN